MYKTREIICVHEAAHAAYALEQGFRVWRVGVGDALSRRGTRLGGNTDYICDDPPPAPEHKYLLKRAIIACAGCAVVGFATNQDPAQLMEPEDDDRASIAEFAQRMRDLGFSEEQIEKWRSQAWDTANHLARQYFPRIRVLAGALCKAGSMAEEQIKKVWESSKVRIVVVGTHHELQRRQDTSKDRERLRDEFESLLSQIIKEQNTSIIAEEAGDDDAVWQLLRQEEKALREFANAFGDGRTVDAPVSTIAKMLSDKGAAQIRYIDIRADAEKLPLVEQRDEAMTTRIMEVRGSAEDILVIVGEDHREGVTQRLKDMGIAVKSVRFPEIRQK